MDRRRFLQSAPLLFSTFSATLFASPQPQRDVQGKLLIIFLRGAYDAASALVPISSDLYYAVRPRIAIPRPDSSNPLAAAPLTSDWGLHPAMADGLGDLLAKSEVRFIPFAGVPGASRSHFEVQDLIELGADGLAGARPTDGLLYRLASCIGTSQAISFTATLPPILKGGEPISNRSLQTPRKSRLDDAEQERIARLYRGHPLEGSISKVEELRALNAEELAREMQTSARGAHGAALFEREAPRIARDLRERHAIAFVELGGWDTHIAQGGSSGPLAVQLGALSKGLRTFAEHMDKDWERTGVVVISEFGRTLRENGNAGTDHGHGSVYWVLGGALRGDTIPRGVGGISERILHEGRDLPVRVDYRALLADAAERLFPLSKAELRAVVGDIDRARVL